MATKKHPRCRACNYQEPENTVFVRGLVAMAERVLSREIMPIKLVHEVKKAFPYLVSDAHMYDSEALAARDPRSLAKRTLIGTGMPAEETHQRFSFLRVADSRARR